jgi:hypothetical protein
MIKVPHFSDAEIEELRNWYDVIHPIRNSVITNETVLTFVSKIAKCTHKEAQYLAVRVSGSLFTIHLWSY